MIVSNTASKVKRAIQSYARLLQQEREIELNSTEAKGRGRHAGVRRCKSVDDVGGGELVNVMESSAFDN